MRELKSLLATDITAVVVVVVVVGVGVERGQNECVLMIGYGCQRGVETSGERIRVIVVVSGDGCVRGRCGGSTGGDNHGRRWRDTTVGRLRRRRRRRCWCLR